MRKIFLACPYSHPDPEVTEQRFNACNSVAARILESGAALYSQVSMSHPINRELSGEHRNNVGKLWAPVDVVFMELMEELVILDLPGWDESSGIKREIEFFKDRGRPVNLWSDVAAEFEQDPAQRSG